MPINQVNKIEKQINTSSLVKKKRDKKMLASLPPIKISKTHKEILESHFIEDKGLNLSSGVRFALFEYMKKNNLI